MALADRYGENNQSVVQGQKKLTDVQSDRQRPQFVDKVVEISKGFAPFTALMMKLGQTKKFGQVKYNHLEDDIAPQLVEVEGAQTAGDTSIEVTSGQGVRVRNRDILYNANTDEQMFVDAGGGTDILTVTRGHGGSTAAAIDDNAELQVFAMTDRDGAGAPDGIETEPEIKSNYLQINKEVIELSGRDIESDNFGDAEMGRAMRLALERLKIREEKTILFGQLSASDPVTTGGFTYWVTTNVTDAGGVLTEATLNTWIKDVYRRNTQGSPNLVFFAGELVRDALDGFGRDNIRYSPSDNLIGIEVGRYQNSHGNLRLLKHGLLTDGADGNSKWSGMCFGINMDLVKRAEFRNRGLKMVKNVETPGTDGEKHLWIDDFGLWLASERQHGHLKGVTG